MSSEPLGKLKCMKSFYKWEVKRAVIENANSGGMIYSPLFTIHNFSFQLQLYPTGSSGRSSRYVSLYLKLINGNRLNVKFHLSILGNDGNRYAAIDCTEKFEKKTKMCWGAKNFVLRSELKSSKNLYSVFDELRICCVISFGIAVREMQTDEVGPPRKRPRLEEPPTERRITTKFEKFFDNEQHSDVKFVLYDGRCIYAHAVVLENRSDAFADMIESGVVNVKDIEYEVMYEVVRFVYTDRVDNLGEFAEMLLEPASRFMLDDLKALCERNLSERLTVDSAIRSLILAEDKNLLVLRESAKKFIAKNMKDIVHLPEFEDVMTERPNVALEIVRCTADKQ